MVNYLYIKRAIIKRGTWMSWISKIKLQNCLVNLPAYLLNNLHPISSAVLPAHCIITVKRWYFCPHGVCSSGFLLVGICQSLTSKLQLDISTDLRMQLECNSNSPSTGPVVASLKFGRTGMEIVCWLVR